MLSYYDDITGLANHRLFTDRLKQMLRLSRRQDKSLALLFMDLDGFKLINENYGHSTGDAVLKEAASRLEALTRDSDTIARIGGNEFALILLNSGKHAAKVVAKKILTRILNPFVINNQQMSIGSSIGIALYPQDGGDTETLIQQADNAMYFAKHNNKAFTFCTPELDEKSKRRLELEQALRKILTEENAENTQELRIAYQSKHYIQDNSIQGYEALIRWQHPELGMISPLEFIPLAEKTGLILELSQWITRQVCSQAIAWAEECVDFKNITINISAVELINYEFTKNFINQIEANGAPLESIAIEITESALMKIPEVSKKAIQELTEAGLNIYIDGFGISQSSLPYLKNLPVNYLKIDASLLLNLITNHENQALVQALINMAHALNKEVIAVGVESKEQLQFLQDAGCDIAQGYYFSKPSSPEQVQLYISQIFN
ncbi:putative bifunctional diguanylate cyclase/phosphodiesterase [Methyloprofundus sp.]|uniref:putative bifunctional diguanylate cyclase/phosphodiesterase n=1 Tax=Methyloprofundus sp. TaxID=2020875 RepID=UPI003D136620